MIQGTEALKQNRSGGKQKPEEKREAVILPFREVNPMWSKHAKFMAKTAGITLSPETIMMYELLRDEKPNPAKENHSEMGDQQLLAKALRITGDRDSLVAFKKSLPHIFKKEN